MRSEEAGLIHENLRESIQYLIKYNLNEYIIEGIRKVVDIIINDKEDDVMKLLPDRKAELIKHMISKIGELQGVLDRKDNQNTIILIERIFEQGVKFLEMQSSLMHEYSIRIFEKLFIHSKGRSFALKKRLFDVFERCNGTSMFKKLQFFF